MNKRASRHPLITIYEIQCPICGETYYTTGEELEESGDSYECDECGYFADISDWPWQEMIRGRISVSTDSVVIEERDW